MFLKHQQSGISLLELLLAVAVFALLATAAYTTLNTMVTASAAHEIQSDNLKRVQLSLLRMERELKQVIVQPNAGQTFRAEQDWISFNYLAPSINQPTAAIIAGQYRFDEAQQLLVREIRKDQPGAQNQYQPLFQNTTNARFRYLDRNNQWQNSWQSEGSPQAIEIQLQIQGLGQIRRLIELAGAR